MTTKLSMDEIVTPGFTGAMVANAATAAAGCRSASRRRGGLRMWLPSGTRLQNLRDVEASCGFGMVRATSV